MRYVPTPGIYQIENLANGKKYIGSSANTKRRLQAHKSQLISDCHDNKHLQRAWNKYGGDNFEFSVIILCGKPYLIKNEQWILDNWRPEYNMALIAKSPMKGRKHSEATKQKMSISQKGKRLGMKHSLESRMKISIAQKGRTSNRKGVKLSEETKRKISESQKRRMHNTNIGKKLNSCEVLEIRRLHNTGKVTQAFLSKMFDVDQTSISQIVLRKTWKYL